MSAAAPRNTVLLLEDDQIAGLALRMELEDGGYRVIHLTNTDDAKTAVEQECPDVLLSDWSLGGSIPTKDFVRLFRERCPAAKVAIVTGYPKEEIEGVLKDVGPYTVYTKPIDAQRIVQALQGMP